MISSVSISISTSTANYSIDSSASYYSYWLFSEEELLDSKDSIFASEFVGDGITVNPLYSIAGYFKGLSNGFSVLILWSMFSVFMKYS